jgi:hypothetical protein
VVEGDAADVEGDVVPASARGLWVGMMWTVYGLIDPRDSAVFYIGMSAKLKNRIVAHNSDPASAAWPRCREIIEAGFTAGWCSFGQFSDKSAANIVEGRLILSIPWVVNSKSSYGLPSKIVHPKWYVLEAPLLIFEAIG